MATIFMTARNFKFIVDNNVGKLAVWLRALGFDTVFINPIGDAELVAIAQKEGRIVLTKDTGILKRRVVKEGQLQALFIEGKEWRKQLGYVMRALKLPATLRFTRCLECNAVLEARSHDEARAHVPPAVLRIHQEFFACPLCKRFYWQGSHWKRMNDTIERIRQNQEELPP